METDTQSEARAAFLAMIGSETYYSGRPSRLRPHWQGTAAGFADTKVHGRWLDFREGWRATCLPAVVLGLLGITGDSLFARIREDLGRGLIDSARSHLNFVDVMVKRNEANAGIEFPERSGGKLQ